MECLIFFFDISFDLFCGVFRMDVVKVFRGRVLVCIEFCVVVMVFSFYIMEMVVVLLVVLLVLCSVWVISLGIVCVIEKLV